MFRAVELVFLVCPDHVCLAELEVELDLCRHLTCFVLLLSEEAVESSPLRFQKVYACRKITLNVLGA